MSETVGDVPVRLDDRDGVVFIDVTQERDSAFGCGKHVGAARTDVTVEVEAVGEPSELGFDVGDMFSRVLGLENVVVEDGAFVVGSVDELFGVGPQLIEGVVVPPVDGPVLP